jgi:hypothetical protein
MTKQQRIEELEKLVKRCLLELKLHNEEYCHVTPKDVFERIEKLLEK